MRISSVLKSSLFAAAATVLSTGAAFATPVTNAIWDPAGAGLTGGLISGFDDIHVADYARIQFTSNTGDFVENGVLNITDFQKNGAIVSAASGLGTSFSLFYVFTATGNQGGALPTIPGQSVDGFFNTITYTLYADSSPGTPTFTVGSGGVTYNTAGTFALATGSLIPGTGFVSIKDVGTLINPEYRPGADAQLTFDPCTAAVGVCSGDERAFFVSPDPFTSIVFQIGNFGATFSATHLQSNGDIFIIGGGGNLTQDASVRVPEPITLSLFGAGLVGAAAMRRRKAKKA